MRLGQPSTAAKRDNGTEKNYKFFAALGHGATALLFYRGKNKGRKGASTTPLLGKNRWGVVIYNCVTKFLFDEEICYFYGPSGSEESIA